MIENAPAIFGKDVISVFSSNDEARKQYLKRSSEEEMKQQEYDNQQHQKEMQQPQIQPEQELMQLQQDQQEHQQQQRHQQDCLNDDVEIMNTNPQMECQDLKENFKPNCNINLSRTGIIRDDGLTSILIVNPTKRQQEQQQQLYLQCLQQQQQQHYIQCQQRQQQQLYFQCQQQQQQHQQDRYLLYQYQPFIKPQQSRVMSLRDYYLSKNQTIVTLV